MKKLSLFMTFTLLVTMGFSQIVFRVQSPSTPANLLGTYNILSWNDNASLAGWTLSPDLNLPANSVTSGLVFVDDGTPGNDPATGVPLAQRGCLPLVNPAAIAGNIAVLYRGGCQFGIKAKKAQDAGALAVVIINNVGTGINILGGDSGDLVTIPVIVISDADGAALATAVSAGTLTNAFIGNKFGVFADDLAINEGDAIKARRFSNIAGLSLDASEFSVQTGTWVRNLGNQTQNNASVSVDISFGGTSVYSNSDTINGLAPGDSVFVSLGTFSQASYTSGYYDMTYTSSPQAGDDDASDNTIEANFMIDDSLYSYGRLDSTTKLPLNPGGIRPGAFTDYENCLAFDDPNASRMTVKGMTFSTVTNAADSLPNQFVEIRAYQWDDVFTDINDPALDLANLTLLDNSFYVYTADLQDSNIYVPFNSSLPLLDNQRYLFCFATGSQVLFLSFDNQIDYATTQDTYLQPSFPSTTDAQSSSFLSGFGTDAVPALSVTMESAVVSSIDENSSNSTITPYPNPVRDVISIPVGNLSGSGQLEIMDVAGKLVDSQDVSFNTNDVLKVDVSAIVNGSYVFKLNLKDGTTNAFKVMINK